ncbi:MAG: MBL fold metallo-hydrolase [Dehalococcoidales bacterium]|nr:MBL fold metallo-hydrolase [Dehalococcoidales bacterium]
MDKVELLIQGYARKKENGRWDATSATVLVQSAGKRVLIDPGVDPAELKIRLTNRQLRLDDIDIVTSTHSHYDHSRNVRLFEKTRIFNLFSAYHLKDLSEKRLMIPDTDIEILFTPGHVDKHASFLIDTAGGKYAVAGDVFWWEDGEQQKTDTASLLDHRDLLAKNDDKLRHSRLLLINTADYIIPGHGKEFAVSR